MPALGELVDLHAHVLPGLDDGVRSLAESVELGRSLAAAGVGTVAATPHVSDRYPTTPARMERALERVRGALAGAGVDLEVAAGAELSLAWAERLDDASLRRLSLGGRGYLLLEFPREGWPPGLASRLASLAARGFGVLLAHPERNALVQAAPQRLAGLVDGGALVQATAAALLGRGESAVSARALLAGGLVHVVASDVHRPGSRPPLVAATAVLPPRLAGWLARDVPAALLAGAPPPPRPAPGRGSARFTIGRFVQKAVDFVEERK